MEYVLTVRDLTKRYGHFTALDGLSMSVPKEAIYGLIGRNGAGKTTLIRVICGLQAPTSDTYSLCGRDWKDRSIFRFRRRMGAVVETPSIAPRSPPCGAAWTFWSGRRSSRRWSSI